MPINSSHEFTLAEIQMIEMNNLSVADVRQALADFSVNAEGANELELETAITIALDRKSGRTLPLESYLVNEVSEEVAREGQGEAEAVDEDIVVMPETTPVEEEPAVE